MQSKKGSIRIVIGMGLILSSALFTWAMPEMISAAFIGALTLLSGVIANEKEELLRKYNQTSKTETV